MYLNKFKYVSIKIFKKDSVLHLPPEWRQEGHMMINAGSLYKLRVTPADSQQENEALSSETTEIEFFQQPKWVWKKILPLNPQKKIQSPAHTLILAWVENSAMPYQTSNLWNNWVFNLLHLW